MAELCPEALYGIHGEPNTQGRCPYCGARLVARNWNGRKPTGRQSMGRTGSITHREEERLDRRQRDPWGQIVVPPEQDPLGIDPDESIYYD